MTKLSKLIFGQVTNRIHGRKVCFIHIDDHTQLITKVNSDIYHETSLGCYFFFKFNPNTLHIESIKSAREATATDLDVALKNLDSASTNLVNKMNVLEKREREEALRAAGVVLSGFWTVVQAIQGINALLVWEPVNAVAGISIAVGAGIITKLQYESLTDAQKASLDALAEFKIALTRYQVTVKRYLPEDMTENVVLAEHTFNGIASKLKRIFSNVTADGVASNNVNFATA